MLFHAENPATPVPQNPREASSWVKKNESMFNFVLASFHERFDCYCLIKKKHAVCKWRHGVLRVARRNPIRRRDGCALDYADDAAIVAFIFSYSNLYDIRM